jgi:hyaluronoglucosaminidase
MKPHLGIVEGRFGIPWTFGERTHVMRTAARHGYRFYHYGPKAVDKLRHDWRQEFSRDETEALARFAAECREHKVRFGICLTPVGATHPFDDAARADLRRRIAAFDNIGVDDLVILFDDLPGGLPELAARQADVVDYCSSITQAGSIYFCPSYYSDDPVLDRVFGERPRGYLTELGKRIDPRVRIYWTGEEVCAHEFGTAHLDRIAGELRRPVCLWDNLSANDGPRRSQFLNIRGVTGRNARIADHISGHAMNPATQPQLCLIQLLTLADSYAEGDRYSYAASMRAAATRLFGKQLATMLHEDMLTLQDVGHAKLGDRRAELEARYAAIDHPAAREVVAFARGEWVVETLEVKTD